jgi:hypothetical protein
MWEPNKCGSRFITNVGADSSAIGMFGEVGSPSASRSLCVARAGGCHPRGPVYGDPLGKGRYRVRFLIALRAGSGFDWGFSTRLLSRENGRPSWPAPWRA